MNIQGQIENDILNINLDAALSVLNNTNKHSVPYKLAYMVIEKSIIDSFGDFDYNVSHINAEFNEVMQIYNEVCC